MSSTTNMQHRALKFRHRVNWRGKLILQAFIDPQGNCGDIDKGGYVSMFAYWRDARVEDITWSQTAAPRD